jgi:hypothetical protein
MTPSPAHPLTSVKRAPGALPAQRIWVSIVFQGGSAKATACTPLLASPLRCHLGQDWVVGHLSHPTASLDATQRCHSVNMSLALVLQGLCSLCSAGAANSVWQDQPLPTPDNSPSSPPNQQGPVTETGASSTLPAYSGGHLQHGPHPCGCQPTKHTYSPGAGQQVASTSVSAQATPQAQGSRWQAHLHRRHLATGGKHTYTAGTWQQVASPPTFSAGTGKVASQETWQAHLLTPQT